MAGELSFALIDSRSFAWTAGGVLAYRAALLGRQLGGQLVERTVYGQVLKDASAVEGEEEGSQALFEESPRYMVVVSGPKAIPKGAVLDEVFRDPSYVPLGDGGPPEDETLVPVAVVEPGVQSEEVFKSFPSYTKIGVWLSLPTLEEIKEVAGDVPVTDDLRYGVESGRFDWTVWARQGEGGGVKEAVEFVKKL